MNFQHSPTAMLGIWMVVFMCGGCGTLQQSAAPEPERRFDGAEAGQRITSAELDGLTRAFADRYVGLIYSVCDALKADNPDAEQRREAQVLLVDIATNVYDIASNADAFTRVLDLVVVTTLVRRVWGDDGRALAVFGERGRILVDALTRAQAESHALSAQVLTADQLDTLDFLLREWRQENPQVVRVSFIRFSNFALGRNRAAATQVLEAQGFFAEIGEAVDVAEKTRMLGERVFYQLKRQSTLLRWQAEAVKADLAATAEIDTALGDVHRLTDQIEQLPAHIAAEREALLSDLGDRLQRADATIADVRAALAEANIFLDSLKPVGRSFNEMLTKTNTLLERSRALYRSDSDDQRRRFDIREYEQTAQEVTTAAEKMSELLTTARHLLDAPELRHGVQKVNDAIDGRIETMADQSLKVLNAIFWRICILLVVLFVLLILYRFISHLLVRGR